MAKTFSMEFELTAKLSNAYNAVFSGANQQLGELKTKLNSLAQNNAVISKFKDLQANTHTLSSQFSQLQLKVKELALAIKNTANPTKKLTADFERAQVATATLNNKLLSKRNQLNEVRKELEKAGISTTNLTTHEKSLALETDKLTTKEQKFSSVLAKRAELQQKADSWKSKVFSTIALGGVAIAPIMLAAKAQEAAAEFKTSMMDATGKVSIEFAKLNALASKFGRSLPLTTAEYRSMFLELKKGGIETEAILNGVGKATAYLATVTHISTEDAAKYTSNLIKATGASNKEAMNLIDIMQRLEDVKVAPMEIAEAFQKLSGVLRATNLEGVKGVKAYAPLIAMFTRQGMSGGEAGQTISKIINASMLIRQSTLHAINSMYGLHFKFTNKNGNFVGIESFMQQLEKIKTLNTRGQADVIKNLFGGKPAILAVVTQLMNGLNEYKALNKEIAQQADITQKMSVHLGLLTVKLKNWSATIKAITVAIGEPLAQMIIPFIDVAQKSLESILPFIKSHQKLIGVLATVASALVLVKVAALALVAVSYLFSSTWASAMVVLLSLSKIMKVVTLAQWLWNAALMANPLTLIIGGIVLAIGFLGYFAHKTKFATEMWQSFKTALGNITWLKNISTVFKSFTDTFSSANLNVTPPSFKTLLASNNTKGATTVSYKPTINVNGSYSPDVLTKTLKDSHQDLMKLISSSFANEQRLAFN